MIFVDTSALLAVLDKNDINHALALRCWKNLLQEVHPLSTNNYVIVESIAIIQKRLGLQAVRDLQTEVLPFMQIEWIDENQHTVVIETVLATNRRKLSLVDCSAFQTMNNLGIETAFTFDPHFAEQGFNVIP
ncbi:MAG: PIN domain-containing protein [Chloroflexota bacterium]